MAEMNIKQIIDRLNAEFTGDTRKLVFWDDDNGEFVEIFENFAKNIVTSRTISLSPSFFWNGRTPPQTTSSMPPFRSRMCGTTIWKTRCSTQSVSLLTAPHCSR